MPIVALNRQDVKIKIKFRPILSLIQADKTTSGLTPNVIPEIEVENMEPIKFTPFVEYIYVDRVERSKFQDGTELTYLIDQSEVFHFPSLNTRRFANNVLPFKHLVKELFVIVQMAIFTRQSTLLGWGNQWFDYTPYVNDSDKEQLDSIVLKFNGETRIDSDIATSDYLKYIQPMNHHTRTSMHNIYSYSFALKPELSIPTGSVNFSRIVNPELQLNYSDTTTSRRDVRIHATSMNILQIANDLCCLAFK